MITGPESQNREAFAWIPPRLAWHLLTALSLVEGLVALIWTAGQRAESGSRLVGPYSAAQVGLMALLMVGTAGVVVLVTRLRRRVNGSSNLRGLGTAAAGLLTLALICGVGLWLTGLAETPFWQAVAPKVRPLMLWMLLTAAQTGVLLMVMLRGLRWPGLPGQRRLLITAGGVLAAGLLLWLVMARTGYGLRPDVITWGAAGVPLLEWQLWLAWLLGTAALILGLRTRRDGFTRADALILLVVWGGAAALWLSQPVPRSFFALRPVLPTNEITPYSDAGFYASVAESITAGNGFFNGRIVTRPLYIVFLAVLQALGGHEYQRVIVLQTLVLALTPAVIYLLGKSLHSRALGISTAMLVIFREFNSILATPITEVSNSKQFLSDFPTMLGISAVLLLAVTWLKTPRRHRLLPLALGGTLGLLMLVRTQVALLAPLLVLAALTAYRRDWRGWLAGSLLVALGMMLSISPWLARNYQITGHVAFEQSLENENVAARYSDDPLAAVKPLPGEGEGEYGQRLIRGAMTWGLRNPGKVMTFSGAHFLNNAVDSLLILPVRSQGAQTWSGLTDFSSAFWLTWLEPWDAAKTLRVLLYLAGIALGIAACWQAVGAVGLLPLLIYAGYNLSSAAFRYSGWRFIQPVDWVVAFYFAAGLLQVSAWVIALFHTPHRADNSPLSETRRRPAWPAAVGLGALFLLAGSSLLLAERVVPREYPLLRPQQVVDKLTQSRVLESAGIDGQALAQFAAQPGAVLYDGMALYPRFYPADSGEPGTGWPVYKKRDFSRLGFLLIDDTRHGIVLAAKKSPARFPNRAGVTVLGCDHGDWIEAAAVVVQGKKPVVYLSSRADALICPAVTQEGSE